jgi:hypothetical protein
MNSGNPTHRNENAKRQSSNVKSNPRVNFENVLDFGLWHSFGI